MSILIPNRNACVSNPSTNQNRDPWITATMILVVACSVLARFYGLDYHSLWADEFRSLRNAGSPSLTIVVSLNQQDVHPPLYDIILYFVVRAFGDSETSLRFLSAAAGVVATVYVFMLARALYSPREGVIAAALLSHYSEPQRPQFREVASYIAGLEDRYPEAPVLSCTYVGSFPLNYYLEKTGAAAVWTESHAGYNPIPMPIPNPKRG